MTARVTDLQYVAHAVPDLAAERAFYGATWGLTEVAEEDGKVYFAAEGSSHPFVVRLRQDDEKKTDLIGFSAASRADVDALYAQALAAGARPIAEPGPAVGWAGGYAARFFDPEGRALEVVCETQQRTARELEVGESIPVGLSHVVLHSPDSKELLKFYEGVLGFRLSDWIAGFMVFLRCNPAHHRLAILPGKPALNHVAFDVRSVDEMMRGLGRLTKAGVKLSWGPGRHTAGNNTFTYYLTPNGNAVEYTSDLELVDETTWVPTTYEMRPDITDQWGTGRIIMGNVPHQTMDADKGAVVRAAVNSVLVVGGGIGGMSAALALAARGAAVTLIDSDPQWRVYGAGITLTGMSLRAFDDLGVLPEIRERGFVHDGMRPLRFDGEPLGPPMRAPAGAPPVLHGGGILRPVLHEILSARVRQAGITIRLGVAVAALVQDSEGVEVTLSDGFTQRCELVVAADGIYSAMRARLFPDAAKPQFTDQGCWRIVAERPPQVDRAEIYFGGPLKLGMSPISQRQMYVFVLEHVPGNPRFAPETHVEHLSALMAPFGGNVPAVRAALGADSQIVYRPLEWLMLPGRWYQGRVVLIGDAAHATTPHLASGAGLAVEDGLVLADELGKTADVAAALHAFMQRRLERAQLVVEASVRQGEMEIRGADRAEQTRLLAAATRALAQPY